MQFDIHNRLSSYGEFVNRVARGDRGALVLLSTFPWDSGNYSCEVEVDNEIPSWVKTTVILDVEKESNDVRKYSLPRRNLFIYYFRHCFGFFFSLD